jgi:hypothetical protein
VAAAFHCFGRYREELRRELGVAPGPALIEVLTRALANRR